MPFPLLLSWNSGLKNEVCSVSPLKASPWRVNRYYWIEAWNLVLNQAFAPNPAGSRTGANSISPQSLLIPSETFQGRFQGLWFSLRGSAIHRACSTVPLSRKLGKDRCAILPSKKNSSLEAAWSGHPGLEAAVVGAAQVTVCPTTILSAVALSHQLCVCSVLNTQCIFCSIPRL